MTEKKIIPIWPAAKAKIEGKVEVDDGGCSSGEPFALMVLGGMMEPEFTEGDIIVCEPDGVARDGSFVVAQVDGEYYFRQLQILEGGWYIKALNPNHPTLKLPGPEAVVGVVILKKKPGRRKEQKSYV